MYVFGRHFDEPVTPQNAPAICAEGRLRASALARTPVAEILECLENLSRYWSDEAVIRDACADVEALMPFSPEMTEHSVRMLSGLFSKARAAARLATAFPDPAALDGFIAYPGFGGKITAVPHGVMLHVTAGNIFLGAVDSLVMGLLTKNAVILRVSSGNRAFQKHLIRSFQAADTKGILRDKLAILTWPSGDKATEAAFKQGVDAVVVWGGEAAVSAYRSDLPFHVRFFDFGPKISFQLISKDGLAKRGLREIGEAIAKEIAMWDQSACASPQDCFVQEGIALEPLVAAIESALERFPLPRGKNSPDEQVELLKERYQAWITDGDGPAVDPVRELSRPYYLAVDATPGIRPSPLQRTLVVKRWKALPDLVAQLAPMAHYLQSCSYTLSDGEKATFLRELGLAGVQRFAVTGFNPDVLNGAPHDGRFILTEFVKLVGDEQCAAHQAAMTELSRRLGFFSTPGVAP